MLPATQQLSLIICVVRPFSCAAGSAEKMNAACSIARHVCVCSVSNEVTCSAVGSTDTIRFTVRCGTYQGV